MYGAQFSIVHITKLDVVGQKRTRNASTRRACEAAAARHSAALAGVAVFTRHRRRRRRRRRRRLFARAPAIQLTS